MRARTLTLILLMGAGSAHAATVGNPFLHLFPCLNIYNLFFRKIDRMNHNRFRFIL